MSTRALCRIFGITLVTCSIVFQTVSCVPLAIPHPQEIKSHENVTDKGVHMNNITSSTEIPVPNLSVKVENASTRTTENRNLASKHDIDNTIHTTIKPYYKASASVTALPTSEYVELTSIQNITKLSEENISNLTTTKLIKVKDNVLYEKDNPIFTATANNSKNAEENLTIENENANRTSLLNYSTTFNDGSTKPDIVAVLDNVVNYDSLLSNFMNDTIASNITEQPGVDTSTNATTPKTTTAPITNLNWKKYNTIVRKHTTKIMTETPSEATTLEAEIKNTIAADIQNKTEKLQMIEQTEKKYNELKETLKESASTWNQTTVSPKVTNATEVKSVKTETTTDETLAVLDAAESGVLASKRSGYLDNSKWDKEIYVTTKSPESPTLPEIKYQNFNNGIELNSTVMPRQKMIEEHRKSKASVTEQTTDASPIDYQNINNSKQNTSINPLLYRVNSNYKPLKKLDVQPHKSFTIDPDDNSWRNESINSRGIVYKPKNSSKPFTQVLKNKTESEWHNLLEKQFKDEEEELKERLEKIAAKRKSKKKLSGEVNSDDGWNGTDVQQEEEYKSTTPYLPVFNQILFTTNSPIEESSSTVQTIKKSQYDNHAILTEKPMEHLNSADAYDTYEEDERYITEFDLMKTSQTTPRMKTPTYPQRAFVFTEKTTVSPHYTTRYPANRKGTIEYFPPKSTKMNYNNYDFQFKDKVNTFTADFMKNRIEPLSVLTTTARVPRTEKKVVEPSVYIMPPYETKLGNVDEGSYVIKHYKDFVSKAASEAAHPPSPHSDVVNKFVDSFNRNAEKLKQEFPILYKTNIVHRGGDDGRIVASSSAYLRRLHASAQPLLDRTQHYDPTCDNRTVDLSPAYELHYFVNDEEQKQPPLLDPPIYSDFS